MAERSAEIQVEEIEVYAWMPTQNGSRHARTLKVDQATARRWRKAQKEHERMYEEIEEAVRADDKAQELAARAARKEKRS